MQTIKINVFEKVGGSAAVSSEDGEMLYKIISRALKNKGKVVLDFNNIELITSTFLNAAVGQLYGAFEQPFLREHLTVENMEEDDLMLLKKVVDRAKEYFRDREAVEKAIREGLEE